MSWTNKFNHLRPWCHSNFEVVDEYSGVTIQIKDTELCFYVVLFIMLAVQSGFDLLLCGPKP